MQQGDKVLPLDQKQLQRGKKVLEQEISSFEFFLSLSLFSFFKPDSNSISLLWYRAGVFALAGGASRNFSVPADCAGCVPGWGPVPGDLAPGWAHRPYRGELQAVKVAQTHMPVGLELLLGSG